MAQTSFEQSVLNDVKSKFAVSVPSVFLEGATSKHFLYSAKEVTGIASMQAFVVVAPTITDSVGVSVFLGTYDVPSKFGSFVMPATGISAGDVINVQLAPGTRQLAADEALILSTGPGRRFAGVAAFQVMLTLYS